MIFAQWATVAVTLLVGIAAIWIAWMQYETNNSTEVFAYAVVSNDTLFLRVTNVGKTQIYIQTYEVDGQTTSLHGALVPANQQQNAWYDINISPSTDQVSKRIVLMVRDELNRNWESDVDLKYNKGWIATVYQIKNMNSPQ